MSESQRMEFKTELKQLLDLIVHSLYTKKEIFLRELISNAADAIDKLKFESLTNPDLAKGDSNWKIRIAADDKAQTLTISDNGIGMTREQIVENLGTIARSGTKAFMQNLQKANAQDRPELIGQFGVGFYASFMVADRVTVVSRAAGSDQAVKWESDGQGEFTVGDGQRDSRGTDVTLHLRDDDKDFLQTWRLRDIVKRYSDFIDHPIVMDVESEKEGIKSTDEQTLNSRQAIWLRPKASVKPEEYNAFYQQIARDGAEPLKTIHIAAEGVTEFRALLFIPSQRPFDWQIGQQKKSGVDLYVRRVLIMHECPELLPIWLRFVRGVVDAADLPLNVSRETLQHNPLLAKIKSNLVNRILKTLDEMKSGEYEQYLKFYEAFGFALKEGVGQEWNERERIADLLLFESTKTEPGKFTTLADYVGKMPGEQKEIYYLIGETRQQIANSPYVEAYTSRGQEVLLLTEPVDEYLVSSLSKYKDKMLKAVDRGEAPKDEKIAEKLKELSEPFKPLLESMKATLGDQVKEVRLSARLKDSAAVLVGDEGDMSAHMERLMQRMGRGHEAPVSKRSLELNPEHPAIQSLLKIYQANSADKRIENYAHLLYDQAAIAEGSKLPDPMAFSRRLNELWLSVVG